MSDDCGNREERLVALLYDDGDPAELADIRAHVAGCVACREELEKLTSTRELLSAWPDVAGAPRVIFVPEPGRSGRSIEGRQRAGLGWLLPSLAAAATVVLMLAGAASVLRFQVGPDGGVHVGLSGSARATVQPSALVTRQDLDQGLAQTTAYLETLLRTARDQDRQVLLSAVDQALQDQNAALGSQVTSAVNSAFDEIDRRRRADLSVMLSSMNDLQVATGTELQRMSAMLASLTPPSAEQE